MRKSWIIKGSLSIINNHVYFPTGRKLACGTVCHTKVEANFVSGLFAAKLMGMARAAEYRIQGFPDFNAALADLRQHQRAPQPEYDVCVATGDGQLIIRESIIEFWKQKHPSFADQMDQLVSKHNAEFNPRGLKRGMEESTDPVENAEPAAKRLCLDTKMTTEEMDTSCPDRTPKGKS